jgi:hypothetical protein
MLKLLSTRTLASPSGMSGVRTRYYNLYMIILYFCQDQHCFSFDIKFLYFPTVYIF